LDVTLVAPPNDSMWWVLRPEFIGFIDKIEIDEGQWNREENEKDRSGYHRLVWERLTVLLDEGLLDIKKLDINYTEIYQNAETLLQKSINDNEESFIEDLIKAYNYWISYNELKIKLLPKQQKYRNEILSLLPLWKSDLKLLETLGSNALISRPKILSQGAKNIFIKILELEELNKRYTKCAFSSLREYEPFVKYLALKKPLILAPETSKLTNSSQMINSLKSKSIELAADPDYEFLKLTLSQKTFKKLIRNTITNYKSSRDKLRQMVERTDELLYGLAEQVIDPKVSQDLLVINSELLNIKKQTEKRSKYLSLTFSGLSMLPIPFLSQVLNLLGMGSKKISEYVESGYLANKGFTPNGLSAYYSFLEGNLNLTKLKGFPEVEEANGKLDPTFDQDMFWRM